MIDPEMQRGKLGEQSVSHKVAGALRTLFSQNLSRNTARLAKRGELG
ncbi:MAG: hypothetical protein ACREDH_00575 [Methylocella sp.]